MLNLFISNLSKETWNSLPFENHGPCGDFIELLLKLNSFLSKTEQRLKKQAKEMISFQFAAHFIILRRLYAEYKIKHVFQFFNIDESISSSITAEKAFEKVLTRNDKLKHSTKWIRAATHDILLLYLFFLWMLVGVIQWSCYRTISQYIFKSDPIW